MTENSVASGVEVTHSDFQKYYQRSDSISKRFRFRWRPKHINVAGQSDEVASVTNFTVTSNETLKMSNTAIRKQNQSVDLECQPEEKKGWDKLKNKLKWNKSHSDRSVISGAEEASIGSRVLRKSSPARRVIRKLVSSDKNALRRLKLDDAIRGRLDGIDVLSLGPARLASVPRTDLNELDHFVQTMNSVLTTDLMVMDMISRSGDPAEMVLEGFIPGGEDRWRLRMEAPSSDDNSVTLSMGGNHTVATVSPSDSDESPPTASCGTLFIIEGMCGNREPSSSPPPEPIIATDEDVLQMASECNIPIDIDEDAFIIETATHLRSIHDIASIPLRRGDFRSAIDIFEKILKGLRVRHEDKPHHLIGSTLHNIGMIQLWHGQFEEALESFKQATVMRTAALPPYHPDVSVSMMRQGMAQFALHQLADAIDSFNDALAWYTTINSTRAKMLNNLGVVLYQTREFVPALKNFAGALDIQKKLLEERIRRESIIFDATNTLSNMGKLYLEKRDFDTAFFVFDEALMLQSTAFRNDSPLVLESRGNLAYAKAKNGDYVEAIKLYHSISICQESVFGNRSVEYFETRGILGFLCYLADDREAALRHLQATQKWQQTRPNLDKRALQHVSETIKKVQKMSQRLSF